MSEQPPPPPPDFPPPPDLPPPPGFPPPPPPSEPQWQSSPIPPPPVPPGYPAFPPAPGRTRSGLVIAIVALVALLALGGLAAGVVLLRLSPRTNHPPSGPVTASTTVNADRGTVVFSDDFTDNTSGWTTQTLPSGTSFTYSPTGYVIAAKGSLDHFATSPYEKPVQQVAISVTATQSVDAPPAAGYGVSCWRGTNAAELRYDFIITTAGNWEVERRDGGFATEPAILKKGTSSVTLGATPLVIQGMCATLGDLQTTRLVFFAGTQRLADLSDTAPAQHDAGWLADLIVSSDQSHPSIVVATRFELRDLAI